MTEPVTSELARGVLAELWERPILVVGIVGSGFAAQQLSTDAGLQLLVNGMATTWGARRRQVVADALPVPRRRHRRRRPHPHEQEPRP